MSNATIVALTFLIIFIFFVGIIELGKWFDKTQQLCTESA
jgi:hypothetical protein